MAWSTTANLWATATLARLKPLRFATRKPHAFRGQALWPKSTGASPFCPLRQAGTCYAAGLMRAVSRRRSLPSADDRAVNVTPLRGFTSDCRRYSNERAAELADWKSAHQVKSSPAFDYKVRDRIRLWLDGNCDSMEQGQININGLAGNAQRSPGFDYDFNLDRRDEEAGDHHLALKRHKAGHRGAAASVCAGQARPDGQPRRGLTRHVPA
jgi:hypothetical protein